MIGICSLSASGATLNQMRAWVSSSAWSAIRRTQRVESSQLLAFEGVQGLLEEALGDRLAIESDGPQGGFALDWNEAQGWLAAPGDDDLFSSQGPIDQFGEIGLGFPYVDLAR